MKLCKMITLSGAYDSTLEIAHITDFSGSDVVVSPYRVESMDDIDLFFESANIYNGYMVYQINTRKVEISANSFLVSMYYKEAGHSHRVSLDISI